MADKTDNSPYSADVSRAYNTMRQALHRLNVARADQDETAIERLTELLEAKKAEYLVVKVKDIVYRIPN